MSDQKREGESRRNVRNLDWPSLGKLLQSAGEWDETYVDALKLFSYGFRGLGN